MLPIGTEGNGVYPASVPILHMRKPRLSTRRSRQEVPVISAQLGRCATVMEGYVLQMALVVGQYADVAVGEEHGVEIGSG